LTDGDDGGGEVEVEIASVAVAMLDLVAGQRFQVGWCGMVAAFGGRSDGEEGGGLCEGAPADVAFGLSGDQGRALPTPEGFVPPSSRDGRDEL
jgi:hypothetical protein